MESHFWVANSHLTSQKNPHFFLKPHSQQPATGSSPEPDASSSHPLTLLP
jgi:hypothetical protein